ncbi:MAG: S8 family serine peptidase [Planctomycetota bacterium]
MARLETEAADRSGRAQPDLAGIMVVEVDDAAIADVARTLQASPLVEYVYYERLGMPPPGTAALGPVAGAGFAAGGSPGSGDGCSDLMPLTPDFRGFQGYHEADPGIDMVSAWAHPGGRGEGVRVADCEYWFREGHEDLCGVIPEPGHTPDPEIFVLGWEEHGTAVLGQITGGDNGYGVTGLVPDAQALFFPEWTIEGGSRRIGAISSAIGAVDAGDVVLLEMQTVGPGGDFAPAELDPTVWVVTRVGADRGVIMVAAAGNGAQDLDSPAYAGYRDRGDSGAIIVGAGSPDRRHDALFFSTFGSRVNVQGWGSNVFTTGYGDFARPGGDPDQGYTGFFGGTSSASPIVASAAASLQGIAKARGALLSPEEMRDLLVSTGVPQGAGGHIGPLPDMAAAIDALLAGLCAADFNGDGALDAFDFLEFQAAFDGGDARADIDTDGSLTLYDFLAFFNAFESGCG